MTKTIAILATLDTKGREAAFLADLIRARGHATLVVDAGVIGHPAASADVGRAEVALAGGSSLSALQERADREIAAPVMAAGAARIIGERVRGGALHGLVALGGTQGTTLATSVMRDLPYGFPKVMVSTMASGNVAPWVGVSDITMMFSVTDIMGLNPFMRRVLASAAGAVCGMAETELPQQQQTPLVAITTVGITTQGAMAAAAALENAGYETIVFHAVGTGGQAMEAMMRQGLIGAVLDYSTIEVSNHMHRALLDGGADRLTVAGLLGLPQVICPGAIEVLVFNEPETVPSKFQDRRLVRHSPKITDVRLNEEEMRAVGHEVARRLDATEEPAVFLVPVRGFDSYAVEGEPLYDPAADAAFVAALKERVRSNILVVERDLDINDPQFATEAAETLVALMRAKAGTA